MNNIRHIYQSLQGRALLLSLMLLLCLNINAQTTGIVIGGDVYGGGNQGAVGTDNVVKDQSTGEIPANAIADPIHVHLNENAESNTATSITVYDGTIRTIFGGGQNGRTYGSTSVTIQGAGTTITRANTDTNLEHGGVFGAGDGEAAYVFGHSNVLIKGGTIAQNVYGGGNKADLMGTTLVRLQGGTLNESVFGGSRLANIYGYSLVDIDGVNAADNLIIKAVYGGNDIAGHIEAGSNWDWTLSTNLKLRPGIFSHTDTYGITKAGNNNLTVTEYNSFVHSSPEIANGYQIFVGQVFGGGNGDYGEYTYNSTDNNYSVSALGHTYTVASKPEVEKSYIELRGGTFGYVYGGGNNATVTQSVDICLDNSTSDPFEINADQLNAMGIATNSTYTITGSGNSATAKPTYQFDRVFGGNNKAEMKIQPTWHLLNATINDLYSGGNEGKMTWKKGLLLVLDAPGIEVNTVYGGCRRANVEPMENGVAVTTIPEMQDEEKGYSFPEGFSARIFITDGTINNVYGGNDISGIVYGGNALDIQHSILGDVYGGGNGSYAYTDNSQLASHEYYRDFYYTIPSGKTSAQALNDFRPNAQQAWIHVAGTAQKPTLIGGSLYCGGNSATLSITEGDLQSNNKRAELNIGSYVIVDNVFLGSNGANMIANDMLDLYDHGTVDGKLFSSISMSNLPETNNGFDKYIEGVSLGIRPTVSFDKGYAQNPNSTQIGSFYLGGNLGSITASGKFNITFDQPIIIYDKLVAGCNDANYKSSEHYETDSYNIDYKGGITNNTGVGSDGVKVQMNINKVTLLPKKIVRDNQNKPTFDENGIPVLTWNKTDISEGAVRLKGANIYGGCYSSGYINGGVVININGPCMNDADIFVTQTAQNSGIEKEVQQQDVFGRSMSVFGGGMGEKTEIWGNTTINIAQTGYILQAFGGGEKGTVGKDLGNSYTPYNATINLNGGTVDEVYGGGFEGYVSGNTTVNVYSGKAVDVFGGACNADVGGYATVYVGGDANGASNLTTPIVRNVFGGNDYSGSILGTVNKTGNNNETVTTNTYVEYLQGQVDTIFGGSYGSYPEDYALQNNAPQPPFVESTFVNFKPNSTPGNKVKYVFGGGWGDPDIAKNNEMQQRSYVLVNAPDNIENFANTDIFGAGAFSGLGMNKTPAQAASAPATVTAKVVLVSGKVNDVYGSSYQSGFTRRTEVNVPTNSTINVYHIFGGGYGTDLSTVCDTYEATVNYNSQNATVRNLTVTDENGDRITYYGAIYGGNNNTRRTLYSFINIESPVYSNKANGYTSTVYGAGCGEGTWTQYTEVNLKNGANVYEVYGGGEGGMVLNKESVNAFTTYTYKDRSGVVHNNETVVKTIGPGYEATDATMDHGGLDNALVHANRFPLESGQLKTNTNVYVWKGATVAGYAYGAGLGETALVSGTSYFGVHGGTVVKDLYAAGTSGAVSRLNSSLTFTPKTYAYLEGGSVRNIHGGGWKGDVGYHDPTTTATTYDIEGTSYVVIGTLQEKFVANETGYNESYGFYKGVPTVQRNAYAGGEGGAIRGTANLTMNNGYIGYEYNTTTGQYDEKIVDETHVDNEGNFIPNTNLQDAGNIFGGGYAEKSDVDESNILMLGGIVRNSLYGGGEIATVGRASKTETLPTIHKAGKTHVEMYAGNVYHDVFGGGRGYDNLGRVGKELHTDGYVFGSTEVYIYGGNVGTASGAKEGYGNVFGGGNVGYVYSSKGTKSNSDGYYYDSNNKLTEDCKVIVSPYAKVLTDDPNGITLKLYDESHQEIANSQQTFYKNQYVPTEYLNCLSKEFINNDKHAADAEKKLDWVSGINIYNAVFAGGNVSAGSNAMYANTKTVFGNATATLNDVYHCDLITVGTEHIGGLYGDGNLTFVDGYRELNITNYGTDYYGQDDVITLAQYNEMNDRERAYFELKYKCLIECTDNNGKTITVGSSIPEDELRKDFAGNTTIILSDGTINSEYFIESGFCNIYAGRLLNTIQRADFVGVFGSRMVLQGARDRVPSVVDYTDYTINRVGEVSLNQKHSRAGDTAEGLKTFGNYFGIYSIVNYLGALTSDVEMTDVRTTKNTSDPAFEATVDDESYEHFKIAKKTELRVRNNGSSINKVALAAGVYLEITKEGGTPENKIWGEATGVMELDLINVMPGLGGGYVYAKNVHGERSDVEGGIQVTLSPFNEGANSKKKYTYTTDDANAQDLQTSGNFVHSTKPIFDDCYPESNSYTGVDAAPAHYWFIKGQIYLYNQYISAYTGAADAYEKTINIPLTITAGSHGKIKLQNVQPNKYAYYSSYTDASHNVKLTANSSKVINDVTYHLNDTITYWEWSMLSETDQKLFVDETYVTTTECKIGETTYAKGSVFLPSEVETLKTNAETRTIDGESVKAVYHTEKGAYVAFTDVFHPSNNISHDNGYILTYNVTNPIDWDSYYSPIAGGNPIPVAQYDRLSDNEKKAYIKAPTYSPDVTNVYGQRQYNKGEIITKSVKDAYDAIPQAVSLSGQASFERAYVLTRKVTIQNEDNTETYLNEGYVMSETDYTNKQIGTSGAVAYFCNNTLELKRDGYDDYLLYYGKNLTQSQIRELVATYICYEEGTTETQIDNKTNEIIRDNFTESYFCTVAGLYGGSYFESTKKYSGLSAWSSLPEADREHFHFNYDDMDLLIDPDYHGDARYYDTTNGSSAELYALEKPVDYSALYTGTSTLTYVAPDGTSKSVLADAPALSRTEFEEIPNERYHYAPFEVKADNQPVYIVNQTFIRGDVPYTIGNSIDADTWSGLGDSKDKIDVITGLTAGKYYYCRDSYAIETTTGRGTAITTTAFTRTVSSQQTNVAATSIAQGSSVHTGVIIDDDQYEELINKQASFTVFGKTPVVTSTLYVSGQSNIKDLSKGKIITVIYQYNYEESDASGSNIEPITERHIVNIHIDFKSGTPTVGQLGDPSIVLPGSSVGLSQPSVKPGAFEVIGGGWELFASKDDAEKHINGVEFDNDETKLYWYQNNVYQISYYAKTYLGKTYSNPVSVKVANYHDLDMVMRDKEHHMYIDNPNVERDCKIYFDGNKCSSDQDKSKLDLLKDLFDLSLQTVTLDGNGDPVAISGGELDGHIPLDNHVKGLENLEFIMRGNVAPKKYTTWSPIGSGNDCFEGNLHADGYTISGLDNSLFGSLCGNVYNLGVTGTFTGSGISENGGYAENCWIMTTGTIASNTNAVMATGVAKNCYYPDGLGYANIAGTNAMPLTAFRNGTVAYNLNGFYLNKRYADNNGVTANQYKYYEISDNTTNTLNATPSTGGYAFAVGDKTYTYGESPNAKTLGYVESRYIDGDFIYAGGTIPTVTNERRYYVAPQSGGTPDPDNGLYYPIWPDDYLFFGQMLTYGYTEHDNIAGRNYQATPSRINKEDRSNATQWLVRESLDEFSNRVYRAPAYYGSKNPDIIHYNAYAVVPAKTQDGLTEVYPNLTAIDFTAVSDYNSNDQVVWNNGWSGDVFNKRVLDHSKLTAFRSDGQTQNLLAYAHDNDAAILRTYFNEPVYSQINSDYKTVAVVNNVVKGHLVLKQQDNSFEADGDHFLVDKQDFNAPIEYSFGQYAANTPYHMWYQRTPDNYVLNSQGGWETISLPFTAELVTTQQKGEITHFYSGSTVGHEYWLREYNNVSVDENNTKTYVNFKSLAAVANSEKDVSGVSFLWDYYYNNNSRKDKNADDYQQYYQSGNQSRIYSDYPLLTAATPYLIGFPGKTYYEFDLSGEFLPSNTATSPSSAPGDLDQQVITFVSVPNYTIGVTDDELGISTESNVSFDNFTPTYQTKTIANKYHLNVDENDPTESGKSFVLKASAQTVPFRAYIDNKTVASPAPSRSGTRADILYIGYSGDVDDLQDIPTDRGLYIYGENMNICVESTLDAPATVTITTVAGRLLKQFTIQPGTKVRVPVNNRGVYIVNRHKIAVTR